MAENFEILIIFFTIQVINFFLCIILDDKNLKFKNLIIIIDL